MFTKKISQANPTFALIHSFIHSILELLWYTGHCTLWKSYRDDLYMVLFCRSSQSSKRDNTEPKHHTIL